MNYSMRTSPGRDTIVSIYSIEDIKRHHRGHWFDKETMRFFKSRVYSDIYPGKDGKVYFVSSEQGPVGNRGYSIRRYDVATDCISTEGTFMVWKTLAAARAAAKRIANDA